MHKAPRDEGFQMPSKELVEGMGRLIGETAKNGQFLAGGGLLPGGQRFRLTRKGGGWQVAARPWSPANELPSGLATIKVADAEQGLEWAKRYAAAVGADEVELAELTEPWHLGVCPQPAASPLQMMILPKANRSSEAGTPPSAAHREAFAKLTAEMVRAGVLTFHETLTPSSKSTRLHYRSGVRNVTDGPFTESKELVGGFCMVEMRSFDELLPWCDRFAKIIGEDLEMDLRPVPAPVPAR
jgi:hypothetical protein